MAKSISSIIKPSSAKIDPALDALFSSSTGPAKPAKPTSLVRREETQPAAKRSKGESTSPTDTTNSGEDEADEVESVEGSEDVESDDAEEASEDEVMNDATLEDSEPVATEKHHARPDKKRKRKDLADDIEERHMRKLMQEIDDGTEPSSKRQRQKGVDAGKPTAPDAEASGSDEDIDEEDDKPVHESLAQEPKANDVEKANRTVFLANVAAEAASSKEAAKTLRAHLSTIFDKDAKPQEKIESIRFRSLAFSSLALPKRAAYITKSLMDATTKSCNAYVVYSTPTAARKAVSALNGTVVLDRHLRVDSVAHPGKSDHRRCVFVGNLGFVDDETVLNTDKEGNTTSKKRYKVPSDVEEGLWRVFGEKAGKVENVRVVRDPKTRVGKGFAYVQFYDINHVEAALLLDGKKFPPMLPRPLRVTRAKNPQKTTQAMRKRALASNSESTTPGSTKYKPKSTPDQQSMAGRASKLLGIAGAARHVRGSKKGFASSSKSGADLKTPEQIVFEGKRASAKDGLNLGKRPKFRKAGAKRLQGKRAKRVIDWKKKKADSGSS